ncbi:fts3-like protein [Halocaridina rubra]|uniref:Ferritin n=1 Tax=Halocaridina rubra TaxID=373956 RepID=A0AAN8X6T5_HALRR
MASQIRQNYHEACEAAINKQINMELYASYVYQSLAFHYDRDDIALPGMYKFFKEMSEEEREHAEDFMKFQNNRGGRIVLQAIAAPSSSEWGSALDGLQAALDLEKQVNTSLLDLSKSAERLGDPHLVNFLDKYLEEQVESIMKFGKMITQLKRAGPQSLGEYLFDKEFA